jgi:hypothetical protein
MMELKQPPSLVRKSKQAIMSMQHLKHKLKLRPTHKTFKLIKQNMIYDASGRQYFFHGYIFKVLSGANPPLLLLRTALWSSRS